MDLARDLVARGTYEERSVIAAYVAWYRSCSLDMGNATRRALSAPAEAGTEGAAGAAPQAADPNSQANGVLIRLSPLGIFGWREPAA